MSESRPSSVARMISRVATGGRLVAPELPGSDLPHVLTGPLLRQLTLFDVFTFDDGRRSLAWRLTLQADDRTLTDDEANAIQERVARRVAERFSITWRGV